ncbi:uncharacterized protein [Dasypus novemcinctus]|uniref:uncharacterized protein n=1 Tax=Dasypus novemcinctus TaxID=9361 RepID=UPI0039C8C51E
MGLKASTPTSLILPGNLSKQCQTRPLTSRRESRAVFHLALHLPSFHEAPHPHSPGVRSPRFPWHRSGPRVPLGSPRGGDQNQIPAPRAPSRRSPGPRRRSALTRRSLLAARPARAPAARSPAGASSPPARPAPPQRAHPARAPAARSPAGASSPPARPAPPQRAHPARAPAARSPAGASSPPAPAAGAASSDHVTRRGAAAPGEAGGGRRDVAGFLQLRRAPPAPPVPRKGAHWDTRLTIAGSLRPQPTPPGLAGVSGDCSPHGRCRCEPVQYSGRRKR